MTELKSWYGFCIEKEEIPEGSELTAIACPCCGRAVYKDITIVLTSLPPKHRYFCKVCGWNGYA